MIRVSIIILTTGEQLSHLVQCLKSIERHTPELHELIIVDNGSTDGTREWLEHYRSETTWTEVKLILNDENRGFPAGNNQGMAMATGDYILLLNNDTVVTPNWLHNLLTPFALKPEVGLVGPVTNSITGHQQVEIDYTSIDQVDDFARRWAAKHWGQIQVVNEIIGFCMLIKREVIEKVGNLDERFGLGNYEDIDLCRRVREAGFKIAVARDVFIHHTGSQFYNTLGDGYQELLNENEAKYLEKWGKPLVFWAVLMERAIQNEAVGALLNVASVCGARGYRKIELPYMRVDMARNLYVQAFLEHSTSDEDVLVMLDCDHAHPPYIVERLSSHPVGVVGALAYRRGGECEPMFFMRESDGELHAAMTWDHEGLYECDAVGTGAIAIKRWVFKQLDEAGFRWPYFRYEYPTQGAIPSEDIVFARACEQAGIKHHCDTGLVTPHLMTDYADGRQWQEFLDKHRLNGGLPAWQHQTQPAVA